MFPRHADPSKEATRIRLTLASCALVCRALYFISRLAMFEVVQSTTSDHTDALESIHRAHPEWFAHTRELILTMSNGSSRSLPPVPQILSNRPRAAQITTLCIDDHVRVLPTRFDRRLPYASIGHCTSLRHLVLSRCRFSNFVQLRDMLRPVTELESLTLHQCFTHIDRSSGFVQWPVSLRSLSMSCNPGLAAYMLFWLAGTPTARSLERLKTVWGGTQRETRELTEILNMCDSKITELDFDTPFHKGRSFKRSHTYVDDDLVTEHAFVIGLKSQLSSYEHLLDALSFQGCVKNIHIHFRVFDIVTMSTNFARLFLEEQYWQGLNNIVLRPGYHGVQSVAVTVHFQGNVVFTEKKVRGVLEERLSAWKEHKNLRVEARWNDPALWIPKEKRSSTGELI